MKYNPETVKIVLNVIQKEFESEENRNKHIISKVQIMLTVASILLTAIIFLLRAVFEQDWHRYLTTPLLVFAMFVIIGAILLFLNAIRVKTFQRIDYGKLIFNTELEKEPEEVGGRLIATYEDALKMNVRVVDELVDTFKKGTFLIEASVCLFAAVLFVILIIFLKNF